MEHDAEAAGMAVAGGLDSGTHHPVEKGVPCRNCGRVVDERFCTVCGQLGADFHRPVWDLVASSIGDMFALDGRLWRSLPMLVFRPGRMTRAYIEGRRARFVPPFRLFLLMSVIFFLTVFTVLENQPWLKEIRFTPGDQPSGNFVLGGNAQFRIDAPESVESLRERLAQADLTDKERADTEAALKAVEEGGEALSTFMLPDGSVDREALRRSIIDSNPGMTTGQLKTAQATADRMANFYENQERFGTRLKEWAPRFTLLFLPILDAPGAGRAHGIALGAACQAAGKRLAHRNLYLSVLEGGDLDEFRFLAIRRGGDRGLRQVCQIPSGDHGAVSIIAGGRADEGHHRGAVGGYRDRGHGRKARNVLDRDGLRSGKMGEHACRGRGEHQFPQAGRPHR